MNFSRECEYAVRGMVALAGVPEGEVLTLQEIAGRDNLPPGFLSKIFQRLVRHGLLQSHRGAQRGYTLARPAPEITLRNVFEAIEGPDLFDRCLFSHRRCGTDPQCIVHPYWRRMRGEVTKLFEDVTLQDLAISAREQRAGTAPPRDKPEEPAWIRDKVRALYS